MRWHIGSGFLAAAVLASGCAMPKTPIYTPDQGVGIKFCTELADRSQLVSTQEMGVGVFLLTVGGAALTASGIMATIAVNAEEHREVLGYAGAGLAVAPLLFVPFGMVLLSRSDEASALSAAANTSVALSKSDEAAYRDCVLAKAAWVGSRADATALAREALEEEQDKDEKRKEAAKEQTDPPDEGGDPSDDTPADSDGGVAEEP